MRFATPFDKPDFINSTNRAPRQRGFSLVELMVAIALGLLILVAMLLVFANANSTRAEIDRNNRQIENGRYAIELLRDDIQLAGFYGEIDMGKINLLALPGAMPDLCSIALLESTLPVGTLGVIRLHVQGVDNYNPGAAAPDNLACLTGANAVKPGTDVIAVRRAKTCVAGVADCDTVADLAGKPVLQIPLCTTPPATAASNTTTHALAIYPSATEFVHRNNNIGCTSSASLRPYVIYVYFVGTDNVLKRAQFVNGTGLGNVTSLVDGIENLQFDYGVDNNNDGNADAYVASPATLADWSNVVSVRINVLARNHEPSPGYVNDKRYVLGSSGYTVNPTGDNIRRHAYSSLVRVTNVSARRELP